MLEIKKKIIRRQSLTLQRKRKKYESVISPQQQYNIETAPQCSWNFWAIISNSGSHLWMMKKIHEYQTFIIDRIRFLTISAIFNSIQQLLIQEKYKNSPFLSSPEFASKSLWNIIWQYSIMESPCVNYMSQLQTDVFWRCINEFDDANNQCCLGGASVRYTLLSLTTEVDSIPGFIQ